MIVNIGYKVESKGPSLPYSNGLISEMSHQN